MSDDSNPYLEAARANKSGDTSEDPIQNSGFNVSISGPDGRKMDIDLGELLGGGPQTSDARFINAYETGNKLWSSGTKLLKAHRWALDGTIDAVAALEYADLVQDYHSQSLEDGTPSAVFAELPSAFKYREIVETRYRLAFAHSIRLFVDYNSHLPFNDRTVNLKDTIGIDAELSIILDEAFGGYSFFLGHYVGFVIGKLTDNYIDSTAGMFIKEADPGQEERFLLQGILPDAYRYDSHKGSIHDARTSALQMYQMNTSAKCQRHHSTSLEHDQLLGEFKEIIDA